MGYESELYICKRKSARSKSIVQCGKVDLGKINYLDFDLPRKKTLVKIFTEPLGCELVDDSGNSVNEDCYGDPLMTAPLTEVVDYLRAFVKKNPEHRYAYWALKELEDKLAHRKDADKLFCVHYGY